VCCSREVGFSVTSPSGMRVHGGDACLTRSSFRRNAGRKAVFAEPPESQFFGMFPRPERLKPRPVTRLPMKICRKENRNYTRLHSGPAARSLRFGWNCSGAEKTIYSPSNSFAGIDCLLVNMAFHGSLLSRSLQSAKFAMRNFGAFFVFNSDQSSGSAAAIPKRARLE
jgi:hypothetical protein